MENVTTCGYSPLADVVALTAGEHTTRAELSLSSFTVGVPLDLQYPADKEPTRTNLDVYSKAEVLALINALEPIGTVKLFHGLEAAIPSGWQVATQYNGAFPLGTTVEGEVADTGGENPQVVTFSNMDDGGTHDHGGNTADHNLTEAENGPHVHNISVPSAGGTGEDGKTGTPLKLCAPNANKNTDSSGSGDGHAHGISNTGTTHKHAGTQQLALPKFVKSFFIEKFEDSVAS